MQMTDWGGRESEHRASPLCAAVGLPIPIRIRDHRLIFRPRHIVPIVRLLLGQSHVWKTFNGTSQQLERRTGGQETRGKMSRKRVSFH